MKRDSYKMYNKKIFFYENFFLRNIFKEKIDAFYAQSNQNTSINFEEG